MVKTLLTFGDSNTYGIAPMTNVETSTRYGIGVRWPTVTHTALGTDWHLVEEGLPGRTATPAAHPHRGGHMDGVIGLRIALESHGPVDMLTIMLGTNDCQSCYGLTDKGITAHIAGLLTLARSTDMRKQHPDMEILLICPPPVREVGIFTDTAYGAAEISAGLPALYAALATHWRIKFLDAGQHITSSAEDGVHFDAAAHQSLGTAVANIINA
jgi:lysophospholipase L1-like esterase